MSNFEFEKEHDELDYQLDMMLDQLGPDRLPVGFTARTMEVIRLESAVQPRSVIEPVPFRLHWTDLVPAFAAAVVGIIVMFIWSGAAGELFSWIQVDGLLPSVNDFQIAALFSVIGLLVAAIPLLSGNTRSRGSLFLLALS